MAVSARTRKCQLGDEGTGAATWGTATAATAIWLGTVTMQDLTNVMHIEESIGNYLGYGRTYIPSEGAEINFESVPATYEQLGYPLYAGIDGEAGNDAFVVHGQLSRPRATLRDTRWIPACLRNVIPRTTLWCDVSLSALSTAWLVAPDWTRRRMSACRASSSARLCPSM